MRIAVLYSFFYFSVLVINFLANYLPLNGVTTGEISDRYDSLITPAGLAFSIWGIIYLFLFIWIVQIWLGAFKKKSEIITEARKLILFFPLSCLLNIGWIISWHYGYINLSVIIIAGMLLSLIFIYRRSDHFQNLWRFPFSTYLAWISVATIVNVSVIFIHNEWVLFPGERINSTIMMMLVATLLGLYMLHRKTDLYFGLVIIWALFFIAIKNVELQSIFISGIGFVAILLLNLISVLWLKWRVIFKKSI